MQFEILAIVPAGPAIPVSLSPHSVSAAGFTAVLVPARTGFLTGRKLRKQRLAEAPERQRLLEKLMEFGPVLPCAPGSRLSKDEVTALIAANHDVLTRLRTLLEGRVQYQVSVTWNEPQVLAHFRKAPEIAPLFSSEKVAPATVARAVSKLAERLGCLVAEQLSVVACDMADLPREAGMVSNHVLLVREAREADLDTAIGVIDAIWSEGFTIRQIGPAPAGSFATLRMRRVKRRDLSSALDCLDLAAHCAQDDVEEARQRLLRLPGANVEEIRFAARLVRAGIAAGQADADILLLDEWSEGRAVAAGLEHVA